MLRPPDNASILEAIRATARRAPASVALLAPGRKPTSYDALVEQVETIVRYLRAGGIAPTDRVAVVLPNGPEAAAAVLGTVAAAACAPLAPDLPESEFAKQLTTLGVRAVMVLRGHETAARAASLCGIPVIELDAGAAAGSISCSGLSPGDGASSSAGDPTRPCCCSPLARRVLRSSSRSPNAIC